MNAIIDILVHGATTAFLIWIWTRRSRKEAQEWKALALRATALAKWYSRQLMSALQAVDESRCAKTQKMVLAAVRPHLVPDEDLTPVPNEQSIHNQKAS